MQHFVFDQKYAKKGASRAQHRAAERVDASGDLVDLVSVVYLNMVRIPLPHSLGGALNFQDIKQIEQHPHGPYTRDPHRVKNVLDPMVVKVALEEWMKESMSLIKQVCP